MEETEDTVSADGSGTRNLLEQIEVLMKCPQADRKEIERITNIVQEELSKRSERHKRKIQEYKECIRQKEKQLNMLEETEVIRSMRESAELYTDQIMQLISEREVQRTQWEKEKEKLVKINNKIYAELALKNKEFLKLIQKNQELMKYIAEMKLQPKRIQECKKLLTEFEKKYLDLKAQTEVSFESINKKWHNEKESHEKQQKKLMALCRSAKVKINILENDMKRLSRENLKLHKNFIQKLSKRDSDN